MRDDKNGGLVGRAARFGDSVRDGLFGIIVRPLPFLFGVRSVGGTAGDLFGCAFGKIVRSLLFLFGNRSAVAVFVRGLFGAGRRPAASRSGQLVAFDVLVAALVFLLLAGVFSTISEANRQAPLSAYAGLETQAERLSDRLVQGPGVPADWAPGTVEWLGLAEAPGVLSPVKVAYLPLLSSARLANASLRSRELVQLRLENESGGVWLANGTPVIVGPTPDSTANVAVVRRLVLVDGQPARLLVSVWTNDTG